ncbi:MAG TPA: hypothetical protein VN721_02310 [Flavipsychrobacter sp.]|nr:hypothetical protein [Flavipsychrobacter sp.]
MKTAYVCYSNKGEYGLADLENEELFEFLKEKGVDVHSEVWSDPTIEWERYDNVILKAPWDYVEKIDQFRSWLDKLDSLNVRLLNSTNTIRWNIDKHYLKDIADAGLNVIETIYLEKGSNIDFKNCFYSLNTEKIVVKPCISASSKNTFAVSVDEAEQFTPLINDLLKEGDYMVQPFLKEIQQSGEVSFMFFNGAFSHSVIKRPKSGDFRTQEHLGGTIHPFTPSAELLLSIQKYIDNFAQNCLYIRVDGTIVNETFLLMELELVDPYLYLFISSGSYDLYYDALIAYTRSSVAS